MTPVYTKYYYALVSLLGAGQGGGCTVLAIDLFLTCMELELLSHL